MQLSTQTSLNGRDASSEALTPTSVSSHTKHQWDPLPTLTSAVVSSSETTGLDALLTARSVVHQPTPELLSELSWEPKEIFARPISSSTIPHIVEQPFVMTFHLSVSLFHSHSPQMLDQLHWHRASLAQPTMLEHQDGELNAFVGFERMFELILGLTGVRLVIQVQPPSIFNGLESTSSPTRFVARVFQQLKQLASSTQLSAHRRQLERACAWEILEVKSLLLFIRNNNDERQIYIPFLDDSQVHWLMPEPLSVLSHGEFHAVVDHLTCLHVSATSAIGSTRKWIATKCETNSNIQSLTIWNPNKLNFIPLEKLEEIIFIVSDLLS